MIPFVCHVACPGCYLWFTSILRESPRFCEWVPEQQHMAFMFPTLLLWQDPLSLLFWYARPICQYLTCV